MIATGDWKTFHLVNYLVSVRPTLTDPEMSRLSETPAFLKKGTEKEQSAAGISPKVQRYRAKDLYEPISVFHEFGLPVIDWGANIQWRPKSDEGEFLWWIMPVAEYSSNQCTAEFVFSLGLRRAPPLTEILRIASSDNLFIRTKALSFFLDNISNNYSDYDPENFRDLAFVPAIFGSEKVLAKPFEVSDLTPCFLSSKPTYGSSTLALNGQH